MITEGEVQGVTLKSPQSVTREQLVQIHEAQYLDRLWAKDPRFLASTLASTGGVLAALDQALIDGANTPPVLAKILARNCGSLAHNRSRYCAS